LWKAALLKKRILFYSPPPVEEACYSGISLFIIIFFFLFFSWNLWNLSIYLSLFVFKKVYGTCLIANVPSAISRTLRNKVDKMRPLFNVGVSDIPMVEATEGGYVACKYYNHYYYSTCEILY
jgi:hypothetical protein